MGKQCTGLNSRLFRPNLLFSLVGTITPTRVKRCVIVGRDCVYSARWRSCGYSGLNLGCTCDLINERISVLNSVFRTAILFIHSGQHRSKWLESSD